MKIRINREEDRLTVAAILVKNGYQVVQVKEKPTPTSRSYVYYIEAKEVESK